MFAAESVTVPAVVFTSPALPSRIADTVPFCRSNAVVLVKTPLVPEIAPVVRCTPATVSLKAPTSSVPPSTFTLVASAITLLAP